MPDNDKLSKASVHYRIGTHAKRCGNCSMYRDQSCTLVKGIIDPSYVCDRWDRKSTTETSRELYLIRHGATALNSESGGPDRIRGWKNLPLSDKGKQEARQLAQQLQDSGITTLISSPMMRAHDTAEAIAKVTHAKVKLEPKLKPWDLGEFTGQESKSVYPVIMKFAMEKPDRKVPGGESFDEFKHRAFDGLKDICDLSLPDYLAVVTHHRVERLIKAWLAAGGMKDRSIDFNVMFQHGEKTAHAEKLKIDMSAL